jgi:hypothetical protein
MNAKIEQLTDAEHEWIRQQIEVAQAFVQETLGVSGPELPTPEDLDQAFSAWLPDHDPAEANAIVNCIGVALGQHVVERTGLEWVIASDEYGTELAIFGLPGQGDVLVYPQNLVAKRYEKKSGPFIVDTIGKLCTDITNIRNQPQQKKWWKPW